MVEGLEEVFQGAHFLEGEAGEEAHESLQAEQFAAVSAEQFMENPESDVLVEAILSPDFAFPVQGMEALSEFEQCFDEVFGGSGLGQHLFLGDILEVVESFASAAAEDRLPAGQ